MQACVACAISAQAYGQALAPNDAVTVDPDVHKVILENEYIRVFDARASKGTKSPMHSHPPFVLVSLDSTRFRMTLPDGKTSLFDLNPGQALWVEGAQHSWELLAGELHVIGVEIKSAQKTGRAAGRAGSPGERRRSRSTRMRITCCSRIRTSESSKGALRIGRKSPMHNHPPTLLVSLDWMRLKLSLPDGKTAIHDFSPSQVLWLGDGATHSWEAIAGGGRVIAIEVKAAKPAGG